MGDCESESLSLSLSCLIAHSCLKRKWAGREACILCWAFQQTNKQIMLQFRCCRLISILLLQDGNEAEVPNGFCKSKCPLTTNSVSKCHFNHWHLASLQGVQIAASWRSLAPHHRPWLQQTIQGHTSLGGRQTHTWSWKPSRCAPLVFSILH